MEKRDPVRESVFVRKEKRRSETQNTPVSVVLHWQIRVKDEGKDSQFSLLGAEMGMGKVRGLLKRREGSSLFAQ